ncbi:MAG: sugar phosphate isomerase/epimerase [Planctomycetaceae bacterium]
MTKQTRRDFLASTLAGSTAILAGGLSTSLAAPKFSSPLHAPFLRMRLSLAAYSTRALMAQNWPTPRKRSKPATLTMQGFVDYCAKLDLDGCELTSYFFPKKVTDTYLAQLRIQAIWNRLDISGTAIGNDFCLPEGPARQKQLAMCRQWVDYAAVMGAPAIRIFAGRIPKGSTEAEAIKRCQAGINESVAYAAKKGIGLALENHGGITSTPEQMLAIMDGVKPSPYFGVNFDSGNFRTDDPYRDLAKIAPYAINAQIKLSVVRKGKREPADLKKTLRILHDAGYRGWVALEYEEREDPLKAIPGYVDQLRQIMAGL